MMLKKILKRVVTKEIDKKYPIVGSSRDGYNVLIQVGTDEADLRNETIRIENKDYRVIHSKEFEFPESGILDVRLNKAIPMNMFIEMLREPMFAKTYKVEEIEMLNEYSYTDLVEHLIAEYLSNGFSEREAKLAKEVFNRNKSSIDKTQFLMI